MSGNSELLSPSPSSPIAPAASPGPHRDPDEPAPGIASPGVHVHLADGTEFFLPSKVVADGTVGIREATPDCPYTHLLIFDGGWGGVDLCLFLAKLGYAAIIHLKGASALFPMAELEENLRGMPGGSHLEMKAVVDGITLMCVGYKTTARARCTSSRPKARPRPPRVSRT